MIKIILFFMILVNVNSFDKLYFLPKQSKEVKKDIVNIIQNSKSDIKIAMYNFTYEKFNKALNNAIKNDVNISIMYMKTKLKLNKKIEQIKSKRKLHIKLAIIDNKIAIFGSANWKKKSFNDNYEIINITNDINKVKQLVQIYNELKTIEKGH